MTDMPRQRHHTAIATAYGQTALLGAFMFRATRFVAKANPAVDFVDNDGVQRNGVAWTHEKWAEELGTTPDIFRRSVLEIAEDLSWLVRAQGPWGRHRVNRMHIAVTETYEAELAMCVKLGPKAYIAVTKSKIKAGSVQSIAQRQLRNKQRVARDTLATVAIDTPATVAVDTLAIRSQSPLLRTDTARVLGSDCDAGFAVIRNLDPKNYVLGEEP